MPLHAALVAPCEHGTACELGAIIADDYPRVAPLCVQRGQRAHDTMPRDQGVRHCRQSHPGHVIDHIEYPEPPARSHLIIYEV